jgi:hypothetical protein
MASTHPSPKEIYHPICSVKPIANKAAYHPPKNSKVPGDELMRSFYQRNRWKYQPRPHFPYPGFFAPD